MGVDDKRVDGGNPSERTFSSKMWVPLEENGAKISVGAWNGVVLTGMLGIAGAGRILRSFRPWGK